MDFYDEKLLTGKQLAFVVEDENDRQALSKALGTEVPDECCIYAMLQGYMTKHSIAEKDMLIKSGHIMVKAI